MNYEAYHNPFRLHSVTFRAHNGVTTTTVFDRPDTCYRYFHFRRYYSGIFDKWRYTLRHIIVASGRTPDSHGGVTVAILRDPNGVTRGIGVAVCSDEDQFSRRKGREIARERARTAMQTGRMLVAPKCRRSVVGAVLGKFPVTRLLGL